MKQKRMFTQSIVERGKCESGLHVPLVHEKLQRLARELNIPTAMGRAALTLTFYISMRRWRGPKLVLATRLSAF
jgi:hypothetical protein